MNTRGLPLLSGPPPLMEGLAEPACRKCSKEFNMFLSRSRRCNHCGYQYCQNCSDFQAMMPRSQEGHILIGPGYDQMNVCAYCIEFLNITAAGRGQLKQMPLGKLKKYVDAYNIKIDSAVEKDDIIDAIVNAREGHGCLPSANENYYRKYSVPDRSNANAHSRGFFSRHSQGASNLPPPPPRPSSQRPTYNFPRPDLAPDGPFPPQQPHYPPPPGHPPHQYNQYAPQPPRPPPVPPRPDQYHHQQPGSYPPHGYRSPHPPPPPRPDTRPQQPYPHHAQGPYQRPTSSYSSHDVNQTNRTPPRPRAASAVPPPVAPPPTLEELLGMPPEDISSLSIGTLKTILFTNHVNAGLILEKGDLVAKVNVLIKDEKRERARQRAVEEAEEAERIELQRELLEQHRMAQQEREERAKAEQATTSDDDIEARAKAEASGSFSSPPPPPKARAAAAELERTGLCIICQDDEANIAIVDCGHLAMCRGCSDLVMSSSRECPLCRTRIVTEQRLLRIYRT